MSQATGGAADGCGIAGGENGGDGESAPRRGGRNRTATDKNKLPGGRSKRNDAYWKEKERHWAEWSKKNRDAKMAETAPLRDAAREEFEAEQMEMEEEWLVRGSSSPAPTATQRIPARSNGTDKRDAGAGGSDVHPSGARAKRAKTTAVTPDDNSSAEAMDLDCGGGGGGDNNGPEAMDDTENEVGDGYGGVGGVGGVGALRKRRDGFGKVFYSTAIAAKHSVSRPMRRSTSTCNALEGRRLKN
ncbi:unnamed protein product [Pylaiella littoralis]